MASTTSFGNLASPRRISSWDQATGQDPDSRDLDVCGGLEEFQDDAQLVGMGGKDNAVRDFAVAGPSSGVALINMRDEVDDYSDSEDWHSEADDRLETIGSEDGSYEDSDEEGGGGPLVNDDDGLVFMARRRGG